MRRDKVAILSAEESHLAIDRLGSFAVIRDHTAAPYQGVRLSPDSDAHSHHDSPSERRCGRLGEFRDEIVFGVTLSVFIRVNPWLIYFNRENTG